MTDFEHDFYDCDIKAIKDSSDGDIIRLKVNGDIIHLIEEDAISIAKHFNLTGDDL